MGYQKHVWVRKEIIYATTLNHIESGIYDEEQRAIAAEQKLEEAVKKMPMSISCNGINQPIAYGTVNIDVASNLITEDQWIQIQQLLS